MAIKLSDALQHLESMNLDILGLDNATPVSLHPNPSFDILPVASKNNLPVVILPLKDIVVKPDRVRQYFDSEKTASLVSSIQHYGFRGTLWVRQVSGQYHLVAGGRRYAACRQVGIKEVPVEVLDISDAEALQLELLENFQREDLNPIEETEGILRMLEVTLEMSRADVVALFNWKAHQQRGKNVISAADIDVHNRDSRAAAEVENVK
jgi:ParB family chromosome partitioning protein